MPAADLVLAERIARLLLAGFDRHYRLFREVSAGARERFEERAWAEQQRAVQDRIRFYDERVLEAVEALRAELDVDAVAAETWQEAKLRYIGLLVDHHQPELAETFFNSVITRILRRTYADNELIFVRAAVSTEWIEADEPTYRSYYPGEDGLRPCLERVFRDLGWSVPFADLERDVALLVRAVEERWDDAGPPQPNRQVRVLGSAFYRNKAAYVGGLILNGDAELPFFVPVLHDADGRLALDAVLLDPEQIAIVFSLSRAYFLVDMAVPSGYVQFLSRLAPSRSRSELYSAIGLGRQGKTLFFRELLHHLRHSQDLFVEAPGQRGQVLHVFTLPSFPYVFKVLRDAFGPTKSTTRRVVEEKFELVKRLDRVGRLADTIEFVDLALPRDRFSPELLEQLHELAPSAIEEHGDALWLRRCWIERRLVPLDIHLRAAPPEEVERSARELGDAIRDLAAANVFPGDMLWKNFGVNRHGRVVFYDYDELELLTDCTFRRLPASDRADDELSDEPWWGVDRFDVFPEEFERFLLGNGAVRDAFLPHHADLLEPEFWQDCQRRIRAGELVDFFPYAEELRFRARA